MKIRGLIARMLCLFLFLFSFVKSNAGIASAEVSICDTTVYDSLQICQNDLPYRYGSLLISKTTPVGTSLRIIYLKDKNGDDSTVYLNLTVYPSYEISDKKTICSDELPFSYGGQNLRKSGNYKIVLKSVHGCDSVINLSLTINKSYSDSDTVRICPSSLPYKYGGKWYTEAGNYVSADNTINGCDSITYLTLEVYDYPVVNDTLHLCSDAFPYKYGSSYILDQGTVDIKLVSKEGCDSVVKVTAFLAQSYHLPHYIYVCSNDFPIKYGDKIISDSGTYIVEMKSIYGCDSIIDLHVSVAHPASVVFYDTVCRGEGYHNHGFNLPVSSTLTEHLVIYGRRATIYGCDSNVTVYIYFPPKYENMDSVLVCEGDLPIARHGRSFSRAGIYNIHLKSKFGCDSNITFVLSTTKSYRTELLAHYCASSGKYSIGDSVFTQPGTYNVVFKTIGGCDSIIVLTLVRDERLPYYPGVIYSKRDLYENDKNTYWVSAVPNASYYVWDYTNTSWEPIGSTNDYVFALHNMLEGDTGSVSVIAVNACGYSRPSSIKVGLTDVSEYADDNIKMYPNPAKDQVIVETYGSGTEYIEVFDVSGRKLFEQKIENEQAVFSLSDYAAGFYLVRLKSGSQTVKTLRLIKR